jgi:glycosyltransferase involved in cell wall biosynthesis
LWRILRRQRTRIVLTTAALFLLTLTYCLLAPPVYKASAEIIIDPRDIQVVANDLNPSAIAPDGGIAQVESQTRVDGVEWRRPKWSSAVKFWFWMNDWAACWLGNHLIADHPEIARHLKSRVAASKISTIAYGAPRISSIDDTAIKNLGLTPGRYLSVIARAEPENSLLEIVKGFSLRRRNMTLAVLGHYYDHNPYHVAVRAAASDEVVFLGAIYDKATVAALRFHCVAYLHGHQVGGTNPSLVEALGAANPVIAHDNRFNRWVAGSGAKYFNSGEDLSALLDDVLNNPTLLAQMRAASIERFETDLTLDTILTQYRTLLESWLPSRNRFAALQPQTQVNKSNS